MASFEAGGIILPGPPLPKPPGGGKYKYLLFNNPSGATIDFTISSPVELAVENCNGVIPPPPPGNSYAGIVPAGQSLGLLVSNINPDNSVPDFTISANDGTYYIWDVLPCTPPPGD